MFAHSVGKNIRTAVEKNRAADFVLPIVVVGKTPQRRFKTAYDYGDFSVSFPYSVAVDDNRSVGAFAVFAARRIAVFGTAVFRDGIVIDH